MTQEQSRLFIEDSFMRSVISMTLNAPKVIGVEDDDPEGHIPLDRLQTGIDVVIPLWPNPAKEQGERDILAVCFEQGRLIVLRIEKTYYPADIQPEFVIRIAPEYLQSNGVARLWYGLLNTADNESLSSKRYLTIDHTEIPTDLPEVDFPQTDKENGYLNCKADPPIWEGVQIKVSALTGFRVGDRCEIEWTGYKSQNGSGDPIGNTYKKIIRQSLSDEDIREGFVEVVEPYIPHIEPMENNASALVTYAVYRGKKLVGKSKVTLVRIDRIVPGDESCGPG
ncbi:hypothetical protein AB7M22_002440 [Pseudomonas sp. ADAK2 TE3594]